MSIKKFLLDLIKAIIYVPLSMLLGIYSWGFWWIFLKSRKILNHVRPQISVGVYIFLIVFSYIIFFSFLFQNLKIGLKLFNPLYSIFAIIDYSTIDMIGCAVNELLDDWLVKTLLGLYPVWYFTISVGVHFYSYILVYAVEQHKQNNNLPETVPYPMKLVKIFFGITLFILLAGDFIRCIETVDLILPTEYGLFILFWFTHVNKNFNKHLTVEQ